MQLVAQVTLAIHHVEDSAPPSFRLTRLPDGKSTKPVTIPSPYDFPVQGTTDHLMAELRWYLEEFLNYPFDPFTIRAAHVLDALKSWGSQCFQRLFNDREAGGWLGTADVLQIRCDDPRILSWPWEALFDPLAGAYVSLQRRVERHLNQLLDPPEPTTLPSGRVNILLVVARPYNDDVSYRSIARPLIELIQSRNLPAHVDVLRPPTFDQLREHLHTHPGVYHVLHFDGHGSYGEGNGSHSQLQGRQGHLVFETANGEPDPKAARELSALLREYAVPAAVLNACQGAAMDAEAVDAFASVATALLQSGTRSVVAMAYSLYVSAARVFLPAFYRRLFETGSMVEAGRAGRQQMLANPKRMSARGLFPLEDWLLPVLYQQQPVEFRFASGEPLRDRESHLPTAIREYRDLSGFIGRDEPILMLERALAGKAPAILVQGLGGIGKTTLARGFLRWLDQTGGLDGAAWFDFRGIHSAEYVINRTGEIFYGETFRLEKNKLEVLGEALGQLRVMMVWDNFESAVQNLKAEDRGELGRFLDRIRGLRSKVIVTSRSPEQWLGPSRRIEVELRGLEREERWEYCETILENLGLKVNRDDPGLSELMAQLAGHPLAMRVVLPKLERTGARKITEALRNNIVELGLTEQGEQERLFGTLRFVEQGLDEELRPIMSLVGLHEAYLHARMLEDMAKQVDTAWSRQRIDRLMEALQAAGLMREAGKSVYEMHPLLTSYLRSRGEAPEPDRKSFVEVMGNLANSAADKPRHEQRVPFLRHGPSIHFAQVRSRHLKMDHAFVALTQSLAVWAQNSRNFVEATRLFEQLVEHAVARDIAELEASAYHQLGMIAQEEREFKKARKRYLKSAAISEKLGNLYRAARTYHQLGVIAEQEQEFEKAREWHLKSLPIQEELGDLPGLAGTYHQLGMIAAGEGDFGKAREWTLKSLTISERLNDLQRVAGAYHQLGMIALRERDFGKARDWYQEALVIFNKLEDLQAVAGTYHQLAMIEVQEGDFQNAQQFSMESVKIREKLGDLRGIASSYNQLAILAGTGGRFGESGRWLVNAARIFLQVRDNHSARTTARNFLTTHQRASPQEQQLLTRIWQEANLGPFPAIMTDETSIYILRTIAQARLRPKSDELPPESALLGALTREFGEATSPATEGDLARSALDLLGQDPTYAELINVLNAQSAPQKFQDPTTTISVATAAILALQTHIRFKLDHGKVSIEMEKKPISDPALKALIDRLIAFLSQQK